MQSNNGKTSAHTIYFLKLKRPRQRNVCGKEHYDTRSRKKYHGV